jgi:membrane fusion protein (multidrug efflux system)
MSSIQKNNVARIVNDPADVENAGADTVASVDAPSAETRGNPAPAVAAPASTAAPAAAPKGEKKRRSIVFPIILAAALFGAGWYGYNWWTNGRFMVSTDDAYIGGDIAVIQPKVTGYVAKVNVVANQLVKAGDVLAVLDDGDYQNALQQAQAQIVTEQLSLQRIDAQIDGARASLAQAQAQKVALEATVRGAQITQTRASQLQAKAVGTAANVDSANIALDQANANLVGGDANIKAAESNITLIQAQRKEAEGSVRTLEIAT